MDKTYKKYDFPKVYIIILNYNGWADTIECLESVLRNDYPNYQVIVVDNNSPNDSMEYIKKWAEGKLDVWVKPDHPLRHLSFPPVKKPIPYVYYTREEAEKGGNSDLENSLMVNLLNGKKKGNQPSDQLTNQLFDNLSNFPFNQSPIQPVNYSTNYPLILIQTGENLGFAGGNNVGIRYALSKNDFKYVWLLNNDTVIEKDSLVSVVRFSRTNNLGIAGSVLYYYDNPEKIQAYGGHINRFLGTSYHIVKREELKKKLDYVVGASFLIDEKLVKRIGLLSEDYFLYYEETDYCFQARQKGFKLGISLNSKVYHKEGGTYKKKPLFLRQMIHLNRIKFYKKHINAYWNIGLIPTKICYFINNLRLKVLEIVVLLSRNLISSQIDIRK
ncbi:glycosyl transferase family 2 [Desulfurobacterium thermolithotrophum DSM 11699]|uniref:Glycosyl transferase family 2 n=1 Tax=Desulfurobacterium thermolithotrophum (strain DSM 11699 / BSA) TaxID=868864 RepID=F0S1J2_DESTD|nr:glycosyltransferase family 2 protein [Desulfurobacterium thermolithotrophum]ADY73995.1 glycosyl transferase family 2 [Desulfurobacterium thermolithotrophum DSM 11699]